ncbi:MAG TPA: hypothetical protein VIM14_01200, partial [Polyangia bacterium]
EAEPMSKYDVGRFVGFLAVQAFLTSCAHEHVETVGNGQTQEWTMPPPPAPPVALYAIPPKEPKGKVCVRSLGPEQLPGPRGRSLSFLHISVTVENAADPATWTLDRRDMKLNFVGSSRPVSAYAKTVSKGGTLAVPQGKRGEIDLYFPSGKRGRPLYVSFLWKLHRGNETDTISTRFEDASDPNRSMPSPVKGPIASQDIPMTPAFE